MSLDQEDLVIRRNPVLEEYDTPFGAYLRARFEDQFMNNVSPVLAKAYDLVVDQQQAPTFWVDEYGGVHETPAPPRVDAPTARARIKEAGVKFDVPDSGISEQLLVDLISRKRRQAVLEDSINRSPVGLRSAAGIGAMLAAGLLDPLNLAAAFVPVVGEARYASLLAQAGGPLGRAGLRAGVGALEGGVGMAGLELPYSSARHALQDDYTAVDSLLNLAFGSALGGGLHVAGGALGDLVSRVSRQAITLPYTPAPGLGQAERLMELRFAEKLSNTPRAEAEYARIPETQGGKILSTDIVRELSPDYLADRTQSPAVHEPASAFTKQLYARRLAEPPKEGEEAQVLIMAGGTGAAKTTAIEGLLSPEVRRSQIVYDTNLNTFKSGREKIDQALAAGKQAIVAYVNREPVDAFVHGALLRAMHQEAEFGSGRTIRLEDHVETHIGSQEALAQLIEHYKDNADVQFRAINNSFGRGKAKTVPIAELPRIGYTRGELYAELARQLESEHAAGRISDSVYRGFKGPGGEAAAAGGPTSAGTGGQYQPPGAGETGPPGGRVTAAQAVAASSHQTREAATRVGVAQSMEGNMPDVEAIFRTDPDSGLAPVANPVQDMVDAARRQMAPEALRVGDASASAEGTKRLEAGPKTTEMKEAEAGLQDALEGLKERFASRGAPMGALRKQLALVEAEAKQWDQLAEAARAAAICDLGRAT